LIERPPRLKDGELGAILRAGDPSGMSAARLERNASRIKALIVAGAKTARWKMLLGVLFVGTLGVGIVAVIVTRGEPARAPVRAVTSDAAVVVADAADSVAPVVDAAESVAAVEAEPALAPREPAHKRPPPRVHVSVDAGVPEVAPPDAAEAPPSDLPVQIQLYNQARASVSAGRFDDAVDRIDELLRRFPTTQLRADAELTRADALARGGRRAEAARAFEALARDQAHRGRRGELLRTLGDLYRQQHDCSRALDAYTRALAERLTDRDRADAERGRDRCKAP
jgi:tetratricopeptide (TPR) repeat protein